MRSTRRGEEAELELVLPRRDDTLAVLRRLLRWLLEGAGYQATAIDEVCLAATELAANAVLHATNGHDYRVRVCLDPWGFDLEVLDEGPGFDPAGLVAPAPEATEGRGLLIARTTMDHVEFDSVPGGPTRISTRKLRPPRAADSGERQLRALVAGAVEAFSGTLSALGGTVRQLG